LLLRGTKYVFSVIGCRYRFDGDAFGVVVYSQKVGLAVLHLRENGQLATLQKKWWQDKGECVADDQKVLYTIGPLLLELTVLILTVTYLLDYLLYLTIS